jgi:predicted  nucleic acid-binding Zn-ribbon protein
MTNEQRDKTINFILEQQAKLTSDMQQLAEAAVASEKRISRLEGAIVTVINMIGDSNKRTDAKIAELNERTDAKIAELNAKWNETSERLGHFIFVFEKYISERQNGTN